MNRQKFCSWLVNKTNNNNFSSWLCSCLVTWAAGIHVSLVNQLYVLLSNFDQNSQFCFENCFFQSCQLRLHSMTPKRCRFLFWFLNFYLFPLISINSPGLNVTLLLAKSIIFVMMHANSELQDFKPIWLGIWAFSGPYCLDLEQSFQKNGFRVSDSTADVTFYSKFSRL